MESGSGGYYLKDKTKLMKAFDKEVVHIRRSLSNQYDQAEIERLIGIIRNEFEVIIPEIPDIGGKSNMHEFNLIGSAKILATIKVLETEGMNEREVGKVVYDFLEEYFDSMSSFVKWMFKRSFFSKSTLNRWRVAAERSQRGQYPDDWKFQFVEGTGKDFDLGVDYTECAICKFYGKQDASHYVPYLCLSDYSMFRAFGIGMKRTQTLGNGGELCDYRFKKGWKTVVGWPPETHEEFKSSTDDPIM